MLQRLRSRDVVKMFRTAAQMFSVAPLPRRVLLITLRHFCNKAPRKLRVAQLLSGTGLEANVQVQVTFHTVRCVVTDHEISNASQLQTNCG